MIRNPDRCPSGPGPARPALARRRRGGAVRPRASFVFPGPRDIAPRPARTAANTCARLSRTSLFFVPLAPARLMRLHWLALADRAIGPGGVGTGTPLGTPVGTPKPLKSINFPRCSHCSRVSRARALYVRARAYRHLSLFLGTWEQRHIVFVYQGFVCSQGRSQGALALGTWEQARRSPASPDRSLAPSIKIAAGYGDLRPDAGGARGKFRGAARVQAGGRSAAIEGRGGLGLGGAQLAGADLGNGGFPPFFAGAIGHVGRVMLEGSAIVAPDQRLSAAKQKLGRLPHRRPGRGRAAELGAPGGGIGGDRRPRGGGAPQRRADGPSMPALHGGRIWIEEALRGAPTRGHLRDRLPAGSEMRLGGRRRRGPGGSRPSTLARNGGLGAALPCGGERAGVKGPAARARGANRRLCAVFGGVNAVRRAA